MFNFLRISTPPSDLERALQASIDRKQRLDELARTRAEERPSPMRPVGAPSWIAQGSTANVHGFATGDLVYVGRRVPSLDGSGTEPSAIDPTLPIDLEHPNSSGSGISYWPSYGSISAASRTAYLQWLAGGRRDSQVYIGYVFIFFYGLERRVYEFINGRGSSADEVLAIAHEVERLIGLHASRSHSFASYAGSLLDLIASIEPRARTITRRETVRPGFGVPTRVAIALGELALAGKPIPANLAYNWLRATQYLNTPAQRCEREFELLFHIRYAKQFGDGMTIKPNRTFIDLTYRPASAALGALRLAPRNIPDVTNLARPLTKLADLAHQCSSALDPFSRLLGKNAHARGSLAAFALLPDELVEGTHSADAQSLASMVASRLDAQGRARLSAGELLYYVSLAKPEKVSKNEATLLAQSLEKLGYGIEPDVRLGGPVFEIDAPVVVFRRLPDSPSAASNEYATASVCMRLGTVVSAADDEVSDVERELLERHIGETLQLSPGERQRLGAHLAWLLTAQPGTTGMKKRLAALSADSRQHIGKLLVSIAAADGVVDRREMKMLEKLYDLLGLEASDLYRDVHAAQMADDAPVLVDTPTSVPKAFAIPAKPAAAATTAQGLDMSRVRLKIAETRQVSALLGSIFTEEEPVRIAAAAAPQAGTIGTLDGPHSELLRRLAQRESWPRDEVERLAAAFSLLTDGALEAINDYAYAAVDEAFWEDGDPLAINTKVAMELIA
ncbi:MAG TPA: TerB N-terminal domain-containing protein [Thermoanaerobaculia bacterium]|nr:TerB N-terminal domain-containing protein [Thermoanaerobaculia bacterium]